ncbi:putative MFS transporter [Talaromyces proteolyticus]|uniref:MFS transporter n=1 Tax=Talaromyces proteolyticus TaxID=1131652 RepID=A0AAD4KEU9_9EURO|nr:putative MFS transporter [Talaromyces proteolyticus]KAH8689188.1 putative MFS transporter [Talaromyces proteolyticus]
MTNPRHWSLAKKRLVFAALISSSLLADGGMTWGATLVVTQAMQWNISVDHSSTSLNYGILLQGFGGIFAVPLIEAYGRLPVWFWSQVITMFMVLGATLSTSWSVFTTFRSLQGLFGTVPQVVGLPIIYDMYEPEDWPRMINIWGTTFLVGPFIGPALAGYILDGSHNKWDISFAALTALYGFSTLLIILFGYETYHAKRLAFPHSFRSRVYSLFGIGNTKLPKCATLATESKTLLRLIFRPPLLLPGIATMINFCWPIGITTTVDTFLHSPPYLFNTVQASSMRFAGVIGALSGYVFGYFFNDWIYNHHLRHHHPDTAHQKDPENARSENDSEHSGSIRLSSSWRAEYRLHGVWFPIACLALGLVVYGLTLNFAKHWIGLAFGWIMVNLGMIATTVAITAYALEKFPSHSTSVSAIINMWRTCGGFSVAYFQDEWIKRNGVGVVFGIQAAVVVAGLFVTIVPIMVLARRK